MAWPERVSLSTNRETGLVAKSEALSPLQPCKQSGHLCFFFFHLLNSAAVDWSPYDQLPRNNISIPYDGQA